MPAKNLVFTSLAGSQSGELFVDGIAFESHPEWQVSTEDRLFCSATLDEADADARDLAMYNMTAGGNYEITLQLHNKTIAGGFNVHFGADDPDVNNAAGFIVAVTTTSIRLFYGGIPDVYNYPSTPANGTDWPEIRIVVSAGRIEVYYGGVRRINRTTANADQEGAIFLRSYEASETTGFHLTSLSISDANVPDVQIDSFNDGNEFAEGDTGILIQLSDLGSVVPTTVSSWFAKLGGVDLIADDWNNGTPIVSIPASTGLNISRGHLLEVGYSL